MQHRRNLMIIGIIIIFIVIPLTLFIIVGRQKLAFTPHGYVSVVTIPSPVNVVVNGRSATLKTNSPYPVAVGDTTLLVSSPGFASQRIPITIVKDQTLSIPIQLVALTSAAKNEIANSKYQSTLEQISELVREKDVLVLQKKNPILTALPINDNDYSITPCHQTGDTISLCIASFVPGTQYMQQEALNKITSLGYKLTDYTIYVDGTLYTTS